MERKLWPDQTGQLRWGQRVWPLSSSAPSPSAIGCYHLHSSLTLRSLLVKEVGEEIKL